MKRFSSLYRRTNLFKVLFHTHDTLCIVPKRRAFGDLFVRIYQTHKRTFALAPHGKEGKLVNRVYNGEALTELKKASRNMDSYTLNHRQTCDIELLMNGAFSPLEGFMTQSQYDGYIFIRFYFFLFLKLLQKLTCREKKTKNTINNKQQRKRIPHK